MEKEKTLTQRMNAAIVDAAEMLVDQMNSIKAELEGCDVLLYGADPLDSKGDRMNAMQQQKVLRRSMSELAMALAGMHFQSEPLNYGELMQMAQVGLAPRSDAQ